MKRCHLRLLPLFLFALSACVTTGHMSRGKRYVDPTGVKTADEDEMGSVAPRATVDSLKSRIAVLEGELESSKVLAEQQMNSLSEQIRLLTEENAKLKGENEINSKARVTEDTRRAAALLWKNASEDLSVGRYTDALVLLKQLTDRYPEDPHAYYAHTATAMCLYAQKKFQSAAGGFAYVAQKYPSEPGIQMAWFGQGAGLYKMLKGTESLLFFKQTASRWPNTAEGKQAAQIVSKKGQPSSDLFLAFPNWLKDAAN